ncbi:phosphoribosylanthranilate isomerase [Maribacter algarum]|uniref:phosphoribosylanthranilate isomerase n=1 Tax=Maribacter algarum (ex Zhang et al. 2020) TaxID=2578118 RepID=UPI0014874B78|nr:phosphoribosylanthranilate isomerase [Maribacter algarum]
MGLFEAGNNKLKVKICGVTRPQDIISCSNLGIDAVGFLLGDRFGRYPSDKLSLMEVANLINLVPNDMTSVVLIKSVDKEEIISIIEKTEPNAIQLQNPLISSETLKFLFHTYTKVEFIKTIKIQETDNVNSILLNALPFTKMVDAFLLDSARGGSGKTHNWNISKEVVGYLHSLKIPVVLAGGLTTNNVLHSVNLVKPNMIDLMTGVSLERGIKNIDEIKKLQNILKLNEL